MNPAPIRLAGLALIRDEGDIIEAFVRINLGVLDHLFVVDHDSGDGSSEILAALSAEGLPLTVIRHPAADFRQSQTLTPMLRQLAATQPFDFYALLDADEFLAEASGGIRAELAALPVERCAQLPWAGYVPIAGDFAAAPRPLYELFRRRSCEQPQFYKVVVPAALARVGTLGEGNHLFGAHGARVEALTLRCELQHAPVRSFEQLRQKVLLGSHRLSLKPGRGRYEKAHWDDIAERLRGRSPASLQDLTAIALAYAADGSAELLSDSGGIGPADLELRYRALWRPDPVARFDQLCADLCREVRRLRQQLTQEPGAPLARGSNEVIQANYALYTQGAGAERSDPQLQAMHESWFREDTADFWRHARMMEVVFERMRYARHDHWLTIGDGHYGLDAIRMMRRGFTRVTASDISDVYLKIGHARGLLPDYRVENAEHLSLPDNAVDYVLCKEAYHHFPRPMLALYEMLRVARRAVVLIEPQDPYTDPPIAPGEPQAEYEVVGNYVYTLSRRELEKLALGLDLRQFAWKNLCDVYQHGVEFIPADPQNEQFAAFLGEVERVEAQCRAGLVKANILIAVLFKTPPSATETDAFMRDAQGWQMVTMPGNPYLKASP